MTPGVGFGRVPEVPDSYRQTLFDMFKPDYIDWSAGAPMNRANFAGAQSVY